MIRSSWFPVRTLALLSLAMGAFLTVACGGGSPTSPTPAAPAPTPGSGIGTGPAPATQTSPVAGTYTLVTVNSQAVPTVFDTVDLGGGARMEMRAMRGQIIVNEDGTYLQEVETQLRGTLLPANRVDIVNVVGLWTLTNGVLTLTPYQKPAFQPAYSSGRIEVVIRAPGLNGGMDSVIWTFRR